MAAQAADAPVLIPAPEAACGEGQGGRSSAPSTPRPPTAYGAVSHAGSVNSVHRGTLADRGQVTDTLRAQKRQTQQESSLTAGWEHA